MSLKSSSFGTPFRTRVADPEKEAADAPHRASHLDPLRGGPLHRPASRLLEPTAEGGARHLQDAAHVLEPRAPRLSNARAGRRSASLRGRPQCFPDA